MEFINSTRMEAGYSIGIDPSGREQLVVVVKGSFRLPRPGEAVELADTQLPLNLADTFTGAPGFSAPYGEVDFAPRKPFCDVLLHGSAHAPHGEATTAVEVGLRVGRMSKRFAVLGLRQWDMGLAGIRHTPPARFVRQAISYDLAFGGVDQEHEDPTEHGAYAPNPVGRGFRLHLRAEWVDGRPLPHTEALGQPVSLPDGQYTPMAFGPLGRGWPARLQYAGTYDDRWREEHFPFLPPDFDERYYQAAPVDQQMPLPSGEIPVSLVNLTSDGRRDFVLPHFEAPVHVFPRDGGREDLTATLDTIVFEPDHDRFSMTWRVCRPLRRSLHELSQVLVGRKGREWWQQRERVVFPVPVVMVPVRRATPGKDS
ncbi:DUF2169 domain-containing protein [Aquabacterium sp. A7-Y]|uniref:DUF2169 family type VI secretion system accessory protein n=1 Tax=Aquabacterium sp. A7-Y TaxID=1349605 RepID=UPI00223CD8F1|nr:DUF2169 domain-containing protein [Aquabacterium sp. A7-Y]MCW7541894.1 DUF2169 domain-containing protein [Aquabacterium sp. A7-Y]